MKKTKFFAVVGCLGLAVLSAVLLSADHVDSPAIVGTTTDIADLYAFEGDNPNNTVFIATLQGALVPGSVTENAVFDEDVLIEFNIDNTGDFVEDLVIQAIKRDSIMYFFGPAPVTPGEAGLTSTVYTDFPAGQVEISSVTETIVFNNSTNNMSFFAGPRRDAFYFDFNQFNQVASGKVAPEGFLPQGEASDFFENLNVLAISVEVPNVLLGNPPPHIGGEVGLDELPNAYNVWVSAKRNN